MLCQFLASEQDSGSLQHWPIWTISSGPAEQLFKCGGAAELKCVENRERGRICTRVSKSVQMDLAAKRMLRSTESTKDRASDRLREKKVKFRGIFRDKIAENRPISRNFAGIFRTNLVGKQSVKKRRILWLFSGKTSLEIDRFCVDQTSVFNVFLTEVIICSFNNDTLQKWLVPSFSQHNLAW